MAPFTFTKNYMQMKFHQVTVKSRLANINYKVKNGMGINVLIENYSLQEHK